MLTSKELL